MPRKPRFGRIYQPKVTRPDGTKAEVKTWWIAYYDRGHQVRESAKSRKYTDAEALLKKRVAEIETGTFAPQTKRVTVADLLDAVLLDYETNNKTISWARYVDGHLRPVFGKMPAARVETTHLQRYIVERRKDGVTDSTIKNELALLRRAFNLGRRQSPPRVARTPIFPKLKSGPPRKGFFEHDEFVAMRQELPEHLRPVISFAYFTGCRKSEILSLRWEQVDLYAKVVRLNPGETKNDEGRVIPLAGELLSMLTMQRQIRDQRWPDCPWVFFRYGQPVKDFRGAWEEASKRAGEKIPSLWDNERKRHTKVFHDLRRTGARNLVRAGVPERVVMAIGGWKTRSVFDRYNVVDERDLHDAAAKLERYLGKVEMQRDGATKGQTPGSSNLRPF